MQSNKNFPKQRIPHASKGKTWREDHLIWAEQVRYNNNGKIRKSLLSKKINFDLYCGKLHLSDMKLEMNPYDKVASYIPTKIQHFPVMNAALDVLIGEEVARKTKMIAKVVNPEAVSQIEKGKADAFHKKMLEYIQADLSPEEEASEASNILNYINYNYQDYRETEANWVLQDAMKNVDFYTKLNEGFKHVLINGEEIYLFDIVAGEPVMEVLNPKKVYTFRGGLSSRIEDSDVIIVDDYWSIGRVHDTFYQVLKKGDLEKLDAMAVAGNNYNAGVWVDETQGYITMPTDDFSADITEGYLSTANELGLPHYDYIDMDGNVRVLRIYWRSQRKIYKLKSYDPETGEPTEDYVPESYVANKALGEELTTYWINEWWQGTKIGKDVFLEIQPKKFQYRRMSNKSVCHPGIVGQIYNTNQLRSFSLVDKMKPLQYAYNAIADRWLKTMANHIGKVPQIDLAKVAWDDIDKWMHFVRTENMAYLNSFKESNKGVASGVYNTVGGGALDFDQSASIVMYAQQMEDIKNRMFELVGMTPQRLGEISNRETVGGVERSVSQSSHRTAELFNIHDNVKKRCAEILLETCKYALKGNTRKMDYITNGISLIANINGDDFAERDYGIHIENDMDYAALKQNLQQLAQAWSQNETIKPSTILALFEDNSIGSIVQKLRNDEQDKIRRDQENFTQQQELLREQNEASKLQLEFTNNLEQAKLDLEDLMNQRDNSTKIELKMMELQNTGDNGIEFEKLQLQKEKIDKEIKVKEEALNLQRSALTETVRHNKEAETISRKSKTSKK